MSHVYPLAYKDADELIAAVGIANFTRGTRLMVKVSEGSDYVFTYLSSQGDRYINGLSAVRQGHGVSLDLQDMTLTEH